MKPVSVEISYGSHSPEEINTAFCTVDTDVVAVLVKNKILNVKPTTATMVRGSRTGTKYLFHSTDSNKDWGYQNLYELKSVPSIKSITVVSINGNGLSEYITVADLSETYVDEDFRVGVCGLIINNGYEYVDGDVTYTIHIDDTIDFPSVGQITSDTKINADFSKFHHPLLVDSIITLENSNLIEVKMTKNNSDKTGSTKDIHNALSSIRDILEGSARAESKLPSCIINASILEFNIASSLKSCPFKRDSKLITTIGKNSYTIEFLSVESIRQGNVAFIVENVNLKIVSVKGFSTYDEEYAIVKDSKIVVTIVSSGLELILKSSLVEKICKTVADQSFMIGNEFSVSIGNDKISLEITQVDNIGCKTKTAYLFKFPADIAENIPDIIFIDAASGYVVSSLDSHDVESIKFRAEMDIPKMRPDMMGMQMFSQLNSSPNLDVNALYTYLHESIMSTLLYKGKGIKYGEIILTVEDITYTDGSDPMQNVVGLFCIETSVSIDRSTSSKTITVVDGNYNTCININIDVLKTMAEQMEQKGLYGMKSYVRPIIEHFLLPKTKLVSDKVKKLIKNPVGIMIHGPPGVGKSVFAKNIALILGCSGDKLTFMTATELKDKYHGGTEENVRNIFKKARKSYEKYGDMSPVYTVVIDEIDALLPSRSSLDARGCSAVAGGVNQFLGEMDGLEGLQNIVIIGITNNIESIDEAMLRPGRFGLKIHIGYPTDEQITSIIHSYHEKFVDAEVVEPLAEGDMVKLVENSKTFTGADIEEVYSRCATKYSSQFLDSNDDRNFRMIATDDIVSIMEEHKKTFGSRKLG